MVGCLCVGLGGFTGAVGRYLLGQAFVQNTFPFTTMAINLLGSFFIGVIIGMTERNVPMLPPNAVLFAKVGFCGGFTTFSTFSAETLHLFDEGKWLTGGVYAAASVLICIFAVWAGKMTAAAIFR